MIVKFILEDGINLSKYKKAKLISDYTEKGLVSLPDNVYVKSIIGLPNDGIDHTTIITLGKLA